MIIIKKYNKVRAGEKQIKNSQAQIDEEYQDRNWKHGNVYFPIQKLISRINFAN